MLIEKYVAALDIGTTTIKCVIYDKNLKILGKCFDKVELLYPQRGYVEIDPETLWNSVINVIKNAISDAKLKPSDITCLGLTSQRATFISWNLETGRPYHNFITWKDIRADKMAKKWNKSISLNAIRVASFTLYQITRQKRYMAGYCLRLWNALPLTRLLWVFKNNKELKADLKSNNVLWGMIDAWLLYRLRQGEDRTKMVEHISDISNITTSGFYDPFDECWAGWALKLFNINESMLPKVVDNNYDFGYTDKSIFGHEIKIGASLADQSASLWGNCCFDKGDIKITMGTGSFLNVNTSNVCHASANGLNPIIAYKLSNRFSTEKEVTYSLEGSCNDTGSIIEWAMKAELINDPMDSAAMAFSVDDTDGVSFMPSFSGLGPPINDDKAASGFIGIKPSTKREHLVRAILESITFRIALLYVCAHKDSRHTFTKIKVDGGVSRNDFICQLLADLTALNVERAKVTDSTLLGVGFLAGLNCGIWKRKEDLLQFREIDKVFEPNFDHRDRSLQRMRSWERAVERFRKWYSDKEF